jgi:hypothetical protein
MLLFLIKDKRNCVLHVPQNRAKHFWNRLRRRDPADGCIVTLRLLGRNCGWLTNCVVPEGDEWVRRRRTCHQSPVTVTSGSSHGRPHTTKTLPFPRTEMPKMEQDTLQAPSIEVETDLRQLPFNFLKSMLKCTFRKCSLVTVATWKVF